MHYSSGCMSLASLPIPVAASSGSHGTRPLSLAERLFSRRVLFCFVLAMAVYMSVPATFADPDIGWHLRDAQLLMSTHHFIRHDVFSYTAAGAPWMNHEWLAELPFYAAWKLAGENGVHAFTVLLIEAVMFSVFALAFARSRNMAASLVLTVLGTLLATVSFGPRTLLFGWVCLLIELAILQLAASRPRVLWALPALFAVWVNTHGSWMIGLVVFAAFVVGEAIPLRTPFLTSDGLSLASLRRFAAAGALSVAALFANPYGWRLVAYPFNLAFHQKLNIATVEEWHTLDFHSPRGKLALGCLLALAVWQLVRPHAWRLSSLLLVLLGIYSGCTYSRFLFLLAILAVPAVAETVFSRNGSEPQKSPRVLLNAAAMLFLAALFVSRVRHPQGPDLRAGRPLPAAFPAVLSTLPPDARVFHDFNWGGQLIWRLHLPVFVDSRVDIFEYNGTFKDYLEIIQLHRTEELLDSHHITHVLFGADTPLVYFLLHTGHWTTISQTGDIVLLARTPATH